MHACARVGVYLTLSVRNKLLLVSVVLVAVSFAIGEVYLAGPVADHLTASARADLAVRTRMLAREAASAPVPATDTPDAWQHLAESMAEEAGGRVTLFRHDGLLLGDSASNGGSEGLRRSEALFTRPEVRRRPLRTGEGAGGAERRGDNP